MTVLCEHLDHGVTRLTLNRKPVNALNPEFLASIKKQLSELEENERVRAVVISSGLSVFSAGMDLKEAQAFSVDEQAAAADGLNRTFFCLYGMSKPVITAVNGAAIAGGLFFVLSADYALAQENAKLGLTEVRVGVNFPVAPLEIAHAVLAPGTLRRVMLSGQNVDAVSARKMGIVDEVTSAEDLLSRTLAVARDYAAIPPVAYAKVKAQIRLPVLQKIENALIQKSDPTLAGWFTDETREAMAEVLASAKRRG